MLKSRSPAPPAMPRLARQRARASLSAFTSCLALLSLAAANAQTADDIARNSGASDYALLCAGCHDGALLEAPRRSALAMFSPEHIVESLESGIMATQGMPLTRAKKNAMSPSSSRASGLMRTQPSEFPSTAPHQGQAAPPLTSHRCGMVGVQGSIIHGINSTKPC